MKKFACLMLALSVSMFTLGCEPAKKVDDKGKKPDATSTDTKDKEKDKAATPEAPADAK